jgi:steroid delta-isomerase-like uncharacterized protein
MATKSLETRTSERVQAFNQHDPDTFVAFYAEDATVFDPMYPQPLRGRDALRTDFGEFLTAFPDAQFEIGRVVASDDTVAFELIARGTNRGPIAFPTGQIPPTNRAIELPQAVFARLDDRGLVIEEHRYYDVGGLVEQLGLMAA